MTMRGLRWIENITELYKHKFRTEMTKMSYSPYISVVESSTRNGEVLGSIPSEGTLFCLQLRI